MQNKVEAFNQAQAEFSASYKHLKLLNEELKRDQIEDYLSSNDDFVVENYDCVALLENIEFKDKVL